MPKLYISQVVHQVLRYKTRMQKIYIQNLSRYSFLSRCSNSRNNTPRHIEMQATSINLLQLASYFQAAITKKKMCMHPHKIKERLQPTIGHHLQFLNCMSTSEHIYMRQSRCSGTIKICYYQPFQVDPSPVSGKAASTCCFDF